jgi:PST family polysaccharide transporter
VIGSVVESLLRVFLSYVFYPYLPKLAWHRDASRELLRFSRGVFGLSFLNLIFVKTDIFVLAKLYSPAELGLYAMAVYLAQTPTGFIMNLFVQTMMPTFSHIQGDRERENRILLRITSMIFILGLPVVLFVYFCGRSVLDLAYGGRYSAAAPALVAAAVVAVLNLANSPITIVFYARGLPQLHRVCVIIMAATMILFIYPFAKYFGLLGGQLACICAVTIGYGFQIARVRRIIDLSLSRYFGSFVIAIAISSVVPVVCFGHQLLGLSQRPVINVGVGIVSCVIAYILAGLFFLQPVKEVG